MTEQLEVLRQRLLDSAFLFDDPNAYRAGVEDALSAFTAATDEQRLAS